MPIAWTESKTLKLINLYGRYECLRNPFHCDFKDKLCRYKAYKEIVGSMNITGLTICDCIKRITYMKTQYCYELSKISASISCEKFYRPKASWFPVMHELLFPFIQTQDYTHDFGKTRNEDVRHRYSSEINDNLNYPNFVEPEKVLSSDCSCSYANCHCSELDKTRLHAHTKKSRFQTENWKDTLRSKASITTDYSHFCPTKRAQVDVGNNTSNNAIVQHEAQTDVSCLSECKKSENENGCIDNTPVEEDNNEKKRHRDEFDMFGKSIAFQLRNINFETALELERHILDLITRERLNNAKSKCASPNIGSGCSCSCSDCKIIHKEMLCSCGLPVVMIKTDRSCEFGCK